MRKLQYDTRTAAALASAAQADPDARAALRRLAEICIEAHGIVAREGPEEVRLPLEKLLGRIGRQLGSHPEDDVATEAQTAGS